MPKKIDKWQCDHCSELVDTFEGAKLHEGKCVFNPVNRSCYTCRHFDAGYPFPNPSCLIGGSFYTTVDEETPCEIWEAGR